MTAALTLITVFGTALTTFAAVWGTIIYPRSKEKKKLDAERTKEQAERDEDIDGITTVTGAVVTPRLVVRVQAVETKMDKVTAGQSLLEKRMDEANGVGRATRVAVEDIHNIVTALATKTDLGVAAQQLTNDSATRQLDVLNALADNETK